MGDKVRCGKILCSMVLVLLVLLGPRRAVRAQGELDVSVQIDSSDLPEVTLYVNVTDASGQPVTDLRPENFAITEDGLPVAIGSFAGVGDTRPVDIVFVFDTTGSMMDELDGVKRTCVRFAEELESRGRDYRLGLVTFWDEVREIFRSDATLTPDATEFKGWIGDVDTFPGAGSADPENDFAALKRAMQMQFRDEAQVILILITDAPAHQYGDWPDGGVSFNDPDLNVDRTATLLVGTGITVYAVAPTRYSEFATLTDRTGGQFYNIERSADFTGIIDQIGEAIATQYRITFQTTRPNPDGTLRDIAVTVREPGTGAEGGSGGTYLEKHLVNIHSNPWIGLGCLLSLLSLLGFPPLWRMTHRQPLPAASIPLPGVPLLPSPVAVTACPKCGQAVRPGARFCSWCGCPVAAAPGGTACPFCRQPLRAGARFCSHCGGRLN